MGEEKKGEHKNRRPLSQFIGITVFKTVAVFLSLMTFPSGMPWMIAFWIIWHTIGTLRREPAWAPLLVCFLIVCIKRPDWSLMMLAMLFAILSAGSWRLYYWMQFQKNNAEHKTFRRHIWSPIWLGLLFVIFTIRYHQNASATTEISFDSKRPIICLGDSLTAYGYPEVLGEKIDAPIVNMGQDGIKTSDGVKKLDETLALDPQVVVMELGGHDFNDKEGPVPRRDVRANLVKMIEAFQAAEIIVIIVEVPRGFITDGYAGLERELARTYNLQLVSDWTIRSFVLMSPICPPGMNLNKKWHRSSDGLHPNKNGNEAFARAVANSLRKVFGDEVLRE